jgi:hypothetical protein
MRQSSVDVAAVHLMYTDTTCGDCNEKLHNRSCYERSTRVRIRLLVARAS